MPQCDFNKVAFHFSFRYGCFPVNLLHIFRTAFPKNNSEGLLPYLQLGFGGVHNPEKSNSIKAKRHFTLKHILR